MSDVIELVQEVSLNGIAIKQLEIHFPEYKLKKFVLQHLIALLDEGVVSVLNEEQQAILGVGFSIRDLC